MAEPFDLRRDLVHHDASQLLFQISEIVDERSYLQHGIEVRPGEVVVDAGANVGVAAAFFAAECEAGQVHSFEPVPANHELLVRNTARLPAVRTYPFGLSNRSGSEQFIYYEGAAAMSGSSRHAEPARDRGMLRTVLADLGLDEEEISRRLAGSFEATRLECELRPLSAVIEQEGLDRIDLLKIDVERAELEVLEGIDDRHWPRVRQVVAEVHDEQGRLDQIRSMLQEQGFRTVTDQDERMRSTGIFVVYAGR